MSHYKRWRKPRIYRTWICRISGYIEKKHRPRRPKSSFISNVGGHRRLAARSVSEMRYLPSLSGYKPATGRWQCHLSHSLPRLPLPSASCCVHLRVLGMSYLNSCISSLWISRLVNLTSDNDRREAQTAMVVELEQLIHTSCSTHQATITDHFSARPT